MATEAFTKLPPQSTGRQIDLMPVTLPAGTVIVAEDGTQSTLSADTIVYRQVVSIGDPATGSVATVRGTGEHASLLVRDDSLNRLMEIDNTLKEILLLLTLTLAD